MRYIVLWDNGSSACGEFPWLFDSELAATMFGDDWLDEFRADNDVTDEDIEAGEGGSYEIMPITETVQYKRIPHGEDCTCADTWPELSLECQESIDGIEEEVWDMTRWRL